MAEKSLSAGWVALPGGMMVELGRNTVRIVFAALGLGLLAATSLFPTTAADGSSGAQPLGTTTLHVRTQDAQPTEVTLIPSPFLQGTVVAHWNPTTKQIFFATTHAYTVDMIPRVHEAEVAHAHPMQHVEAVSAAGQVVAIQDVQAHASTIAYGFDWEDFDVWAAAGNPPPETEEANLCPTGQCDKPTLGSGEFPTAGTYDVDYALTTNIYVNRWVFNRDPDNPETCGAHWCRHLPNCETDDDCRTVKFTQRTERGEYELVLVPTGEELHCESGEGTLLHEQILLCP